MKHVDWVKRTDWIGGEKNNSFCLAGTELYPSSAEREPTLIQVKFWTPSMWTRLAVDPETHVVVAQTEPCRKDREARERLHQMVRATDYGETLGI